MKDSIGNWNKYNTLLNFIEFIITISRHFLFKVFSNQCNRIKSILGFECFFFHFLFSKWYKKSHVKLFKPHLITAVCTDMTMFDHLKTVWKLEHIPKEKQFCRLDFAVSFAFRYYLYLIKANFPMYLSFEINLHILQNHVFVFAGAGFIHILPSVF